MNSAQPKFVFIPHSLFSEKEEGPMDEMATTMAAGVLHMGGADGLAQLLHVAEVVEPLMQQGRNQKIYGPAAARLEIQMHAQNLQQGAGSRPGVWVSLDDAIALGVCPKMALQYGKTAYEIAPPAPLNIKGDKHSILHKLEEARQEQKKKNNFKR